MTARESGTARREIRVYADATSMAEAAAQIILTRLRTRPDNGSSRIALSGGTTPALLYRQLLAHPEAADLLKSRARYFFSDERMVPPDHPDSNYGLARRLLFDPLHIPENMVHRFHGEASDPDQEAGRYEAEMRRVMDTPLGEGPDFDVVLLGMGEDGHTASLFPGNESEAWEDREILAQYVPAVGSYRLSFSLNLINRSGTVLFLVTGDRKADMVKKVLFPADGQYIPPAGRVRAMRTIWMLDRSAAQQLDQSMVDMYEQ